MNPITSTIQWQRQADEPFVDNRYSRAHQWCFDGGLQVPASSSPHVVKVPLSDPAAVDPEEALVASISSCHMLWFLAIAAKRGFLIEQYVDKAVGEMGKNEDGRIAMTRVTLRPNVQFGGDQQPSAADIEAMHGKAHEKCFIANSVKSEVRCLPVGTNVD